MLFLGMSTGRIAGRPCRCPWLRLLIACDLCRAESAEQKAPVLPWLCLLTKSCSLAKVKFPGTDTRKCLHDCLREFMYALRSAPAQVRYTCMQLQSVVCPAKEGHIHMELADLLTPWSC